LRRGAANALAWFGAMSAGLLGALMWLGWFAMITGLSPTIARNFRQARARPRTAVSWTVLAVALAFTLAWLWLILRGERSVFRSVTFWAAGITLLWGLAMTLLLSWIDYGKSYRTVAQALKKTFPRTPAASRAVASAKPSAPYSTITPRSSRNVSSATRRDAALCS